MRMKRILALLISICICATCFSCIGISVFADDGEENIALGKPITASSKWNDGAVPENLVDGVKSNFWARGTIPLAGKEETGGNEYVKVDLQEEYAISKVAIYTRSQDVVKDIRIDFSNDEKFGTFTSVKAMNGDSTTLVMGDATNVNINIKGAYRYVRLVSTISQFFILTEVEIYGELKKDDDGALIKYSDVTGTEYEGAVNLLQSLGLNDAASDEEYGVHHYVTRAQVVSTIVKAFSNIQKPGYGEALPFADVNEGHPLYDAIFTAYKLGYVKGSGDGYFNPDDYVTGSELSIMLLRALGYGVRLEVESNPNHVAMRIARKLKLYDSDEIIKKGEFVKILYNALIAPTYDVRSIDSDGVNYVDGENILEYKYKVKLFEGIVNENNITTLKDDTKEKDNIAVVGDNEYIDEKGVLNEYIGRSVLVGVYNDRPNAIAFAWPSDDNSEVVIKAEELERNLSDVESGKITKIDGNDKKTTYSVLNSAAYIYNGIFYPDCTANDVLIKNGDITLVDNNNDKAYEVVVINSYEMYTVESSSVAGDTLYIKGSNDDGDKTFEIDTDVLSVYTSEGKRRAAKNVTRGSVIGMYASPYDNYYKIILFSNVITGALNEYDGDYIYIDGEAYKKAAGFEIPLDITLGDAVIVYLNTDGGVIYIKKASDKEVKAWTVGFCSNWTNGGGFADELRFKIFTEHGKFEIYYAASNVKLDGTRVTVDRLNEIMTKGTDVLATGERYIFQNFWRFKLNSENKIVEIDTINYDAINETADSFKYGGVLPEYSRYTSAGSGFYLYNEYLISVDNKTASFTIPTINGKYTTKDSYDKNYSVGNITSIVSDKENAVTEKIHYYMPDEYGTPKYFAKQKDFAEGGYGVCDSDAAPYMLVTSTGNTVDEDGMECIQITGIDLSTNREVSFSVEATNKALEIGRAYQDEKKWFDYGNSTKIDSVLADVDYENYFSDVKTISKGDILRYQNIDADKYNVEKIFSYNKTAKPNMKKTAWFDSKGGYTGFQFCQNRLQFAKVADLNSVVLDLEVTYTITEGGVVSVKTGHEKYFSSVVKGINIYIVHDRGIEKTRGDSLYAYTGDEYRMMLYTASGAPAVGILYTYN